jgi:SAM-dependent methyltransferase
MIVRNTTCAICGIESNSEFVYPANIDEKSFSTDVFSARRLPDRRHYQWVRCKSCGLLRSDPVYEIDLSKLYERSSFDYSSEVKGLEETYIRILQDALIPFPVNGSILEIGGGNGFFLEAALRHGFSEVCGVEPSIKAVESSAPIVRKHMITSIMKPNLVPDDHYDVVVLFHVLDHLPSPLETLRLCFKALKPGGQLVVAVHNESSVSSRLLKERSPIIDVEHTYLYSKNTGERVFAESGFRKIRSQSYKNNYSLSYLVHLLPISRKLRQAISDGPINRIFGKIRLRLPLGNIWILGEKP